MERGLSLSYPQCSIVILFLPHSSPLTKPSLHLSQKPNFSSHLRFSQRRWDSNAETFRTQRSKFNFRDTADEDDDDDDDDEEDFQEMEPGSGLLEEFIDSFWILKALFLLEFGSVFGALGNGIASSFGFKSTSDFKMLTGYSVSVGSLLAFILRVFGSYGWMLPVIISSILLTNGPKAFLMALALPLGQSALSLAFKKLWGMTQNRPKSRVRNKKKPFARTPGNVVMDVEEEKSRGSRKRKMGYESWVAGNGVSVDKDVLDASKFGGWDKLDGREEIGAGSMRRRTAQTARTAGSSQRKPVKGKLSRGGRKGDTPLLLRLLIGVFPFLGSWTEMF